MRKFILLFAFIALTIADQASKLAVQANFKLFDSVEVIPNLFNLTYVLNPGAAFGIFNTQSETFRQIFFVAVTLVAVVLILWMLRKEYAFVLRSVAYTMIIAGAMGNLIDRIRVGMVVDFLDFYFKDFHWYTFNVADVYITTGVGLLLIDMLIFDRKRRKR
ncbi:MAG: signal peptidase II [Deferribacteraceae bacterium]|jgi:signal peptidase II|nr:signal peptidase II [Deferribacteraceae bacterium]